MTYNPLPLLQIYPVSEVLGGLVVSKLGLKSVAMTTLGA